MFKRQPEFLIPLIVFSVLLVQLVGRYYSANYIFWGSFNSVFFMGRIFVPILLGLFVLKLRPAELGWGLPRINRAWGFFLLVVVLITPLIVSSILLDEDYIRSYPHYSNAQIPVADRLIDFSLFTISTLIGWELMHRSFVLFGTFQILLKKAKLPYAWASTVAVSVVAIFEVCFHFLKPDLEAWGLLAASPILSVMALKTKSFWLPLLVHLYIEACFILTIVWSHA